MKFLINHKGLLVFLIAALLALSMAIFSFVSAGKLSPTSGFIGAIMKPVETFVFNTAEQLGSLFGYQREYEALLVETEQLRIRIAEMEEKIRQSEAALEENVRLKELLGLAQSRRDFTWASASVIARDTSNWSRTLTLGRGSSHGIEVGDTVVSSEGYLVGVVAETGLTQCVVTTLIDTGMEVGARVERTNETFMAEGDFGLMQKDRLKLTFLPTGTNLQNGDLILTSGIGGVFPRDIPIGTVEQLEVEDTGISSRAVIVPLAQLERLTQVFIVLSYDISE